MINNPTQELEKLIVENKDLIYALANYFRYYQAKDDLFQVGSIGLIKAYHNYDNAREVKFSSYAYPYILGEMKKLVREDRGIKISRNLASLGVKIEKVKQLLMQSLRREPTTQELSLYLEIEEEKIIEALQANMYLKSIDEPINDEGKELTIQDVIFIEESFDKLDLISLKDELKSLTPEERHLLELRYIRDKTQVETAQMLNMSQVQVSRGEQKVLTKLRHKIYH